MIVALPGLFSYLFFFFFIKKLHRVTQIHFMDYRCALHRDGNYRLRTSEKLYKVNPAIWRCKTDPEKQDLFPALLADKKNQPKQKYISSKDGKLTKQKELQRNPMPRKGLSMLEQNNGGEDFVRNL